MKKLLLLAILLFIPFVSALDSEISISISSDNIVSEEFTIFTNSDSEYESFEFFSEEKPFSISFDGDYSIIELEEGYNIIFYKNISSGPQKLEFTLLFDNLVESNVYRSSFSYYDNAKIIIRLPKGAYLSSNPSTFPKPDLITTNGERIMLSWNFEDESPEIAVFYEERTSSLSIVYPILGLIFVLVVVTYFVSKKKIKTIVEDTLTLDEKAIVEELRKGNTKQKDIAKTLGFSKSKMSKVVRKLEEKDLITKEAHFKTYKIKLKKIK